MAHVVYTAALLLLILVHASLVAAYDPAAEVAQGDYDDTSEECSRSNPSSCSEEYYCSLNPGDATGFCDICPIHPDECTYWSNSNTSDKLCSSECSPETCNEDGPFADGYFFCNYDDGESGVMQACEATPGACSSLPGISKRGLEECLNDCDCSSESDADIFIDEDVYYAQAVEGSYGPDWNRWPTIWGPLVYCGEDMAECIGQVDGSICLFERSEGEYSYDAKAKACGSEGGEAAIIYNNERDEDFAAGYITESAYELYPDLPVLEMKKADGEYLARSEKITSDAEISIHYTCFTMCSAENPCPDGSFCTFSSGERGRWGVCESCDFEVEGFTSQNEQCLFSTGLTVEGLQDCASRCGATTLTDERCKFCPAPLSAESFGRGENSCSFCPYDDMQYEDRVMNLFGFDKTCAEVQTIFDDYEIDADSQNCRLLTMQNYKCGCTGPGYVGANTETKREVLVWLPRVSAILSLIGSTLIIFHVMKDPKRRKKTFSQLMVALSAFDLFGSFAYAFTSLPLPYEDYINGSRGNAASCTAQGFFIQLGTTSAYINCSLSIYYLLVIKYSWSERQMDKVKRWLFILPIIVGLGFAFGGIPFYENMILWCNNGADYWPDIPVAVAIGIATIVMATVCWHVYQEEKASAKWRKQGDASNSRGDSLSSKVFWQSFFYLMAFYLTWPVYLALQYTWSSGKAFTSYGFVLAAGTMVPLQGFYNALVYFRARSGSAKQIASTAVSSMMSRAKGAVPSISKSSQPEQTAVPVSSTRGSTECPEEYIDKE
mmetsp:Transcript_35898/g.78650  ORF Transcript_35898/g.78650 Transcript_35898/m.78650 type:complete len:776 (+) Transcript_35898:89-2416(+)